MPHHPTLVPFASPPSLAVTVTLPHAGTVRGMGIRAGITLIAGGGFHGKSTLIQALEAGVYNKVACLLVVFFALHISCGFIVRIALCCVRCAACIVVCWRHHVLRAPLTVLRMRLPSLVQVPGDGRELVVMVPDAVKVSAEDGRRVEVREWRCREGCRACAAAWAVLHGRMCMPGVATQPGMSPLLF